MNGIRNMYHSAFFSGWIAYLFNFGEAVLFFIYKMSFRLKAMTIALYLSSALISLKQVVYFTLCSEKIQLV